MDEALTIDRPGHPAAMIGEAMPSVIERPGDPTTPVWTLCDIEIANGRHLLGAVRMTPPQDVFGAPKATRMTGILALVGEHCVNLLIGSERVRVGLAACETVPLRLRLRDEPAYDTYGIDAADGRLPLGRGAWTRRLQPVDLALDVDRLAPMAW